MKKSFDVLLVALCSGFIVFFGFCTVALPAKSYSENENRALAQKPSLSLSSIKSKEFFSELGDFFCDQFPARRVFTSIKAKSELTLGKGENNGVIFAKDGYLIISPKYTDLTLYEKNLTAISEFTAAQSGVAKKVNVFFAPRSADVLSEALPAHYPKSELCKVWQIARSALPSLITATDSIHDSASEEKPVWFRTDHHWTYLGAYECYAALGNALGYAPLPLEYWNIECASGSFLGTVYSKSGVCSAAPDSIYIPISDTSFTVTYHSEKKKTSSLYDLEKLLGKDKYSVYLGGNFDYISITSDSEARPRLTVIKDSFANSVIPYLAEHFDLEVYDLRYFKGSISNELSDTDSVLILYGIDTAITDGSLGLLLR